MGFLGNQRSLMSLNLQENEKSCTDLWFGSSSTVCDSARDRPIASIHVSWERRKCPTINLKLNWANYMHPPEFLIVETAQTWRHFHGVWGHKAATTTPQEPKPPINQILRPFKWALSASILLDYSLHSMYKQEATL